ncbi:sex-determining region Y protein-like [Hydra vulgaris]|uniref:Sex-determining region Y protein n=1 Tax=Hydra vulgaris TaxID=6087 RepID=A0ABM4DK63_HYDVU
MQSTSRALQHISSDINKKVATQSYGCIQPTHFYENFSTQETAINDNVKRPMSSFLLWAKVTRKKYSKKNPHMHNSEISKLLGYTWNQMSSIEKLPFTTQAKSLRTVHMTNHPKYCYSTKKFKQNKINYSEMAVAQRNNFLDVNDFIKKSLNNNDIAKNPHLKSYGYLQNACIAQNTVAATKCSLSNDVNDFSSDISFENIEIMLPINKDPIVDFNKNNKFNTESNKKVCKESTTLHYHPNQVQLHFDNQYRNSNEKETNQTYGKEIKKDVVEYDNELLVFFQSLEY